MLLEPPAVQQPEQGAQRCRVGVRQELDLEVVAQKMETLRTQGTALERQKACQRGHLPRWRGPQQESATVEVAVWRKTQKTDSAQPSLLLKMSQCPSTKGYPRSVPESGQAQAAESVMAGAANEKRASAPPPAAGPFGV